MHNPAPNINKFGNSTLTRDTNKIIHQGTSYVPPTVIIEPKNLTRNHPNPQLTKHPTLIWPIQKFINKKWNIKPEKNDLFKQMRTQKINEKKTEKKKSMEEYLCVRRKTRARRGQQWRERKLPPRCQNDDFTLISVLVQNRCGRKGFWWKGRGRFPFCLNRATTFW